MKTRISGPFLSGIGAAAVNEKGFGQSVTNVEGVYTIRPIREMRNPDHHNSVW